MDKGFRREILNVCEQEPLFFFNVFGWIFEPRPTPKVLPFITYPFQDRVLTTMTEYLGQKDIMAEKSRDMGYTWMALYVLFWSWMFQPYAAHGVVSRNEDMVDKTGDPDCLFWKLDFIEEHLPWWMRPPTGKGARNKLMKTNLSNGSTIAGYSATKNVGRGGRKTSFVLDEMAFWGVDDSNAAWASTQHVTECRIAFSTPFGYAGIFPETMHSSNANCIKISSHWTQHPLKYPGTYRHHKKDDRIESIDHTFDWTELPDFEFERDGKVRSPWYDKECNRHTSPIYIAQELDLDYGGAGAPFFKHQEIDEHIEEHCREPLHRGFLDLRNGDHREPSFREDRYGDLFLWLPLDPITQKIPKGEYYIGVDLTTGGGGEHTTNSVASIVNKRTRVKIGELTTHLLLPHEFAVVVAGLRNWLAQGLQLPMLIWEDNGPGINFRKTILPLQTERCWMREVESRDDKKKSANVYGFYTSKNSKRALLGSYASALHNKHFVNPCKAAMTECKHYIYDGDSIIHDSTKAQDDPTNAGENHGDRVIADALVNFLLGDTPALSQTRSVNDQENAILIKDPPYGSMAWRFKQAQESDAQETSWI